MGQRIKRKVKLAAGLGLLVTAFIWGFAFVVVKNSLDYVSPIYMLAFRFTIAGITLALVFMKRLRHMNKKLLAHGALVGFFLFAAYLVQTIGCDYTTAGKNAFLTTIYVVVVPFLGWALRKGKPDRYCVAAAFIAIAGIGLLTLEGDFSVNIGDMLTLVCGILFALQIIYIDQYTETDDPVLIAIWQIIFAAVYSWITAFIAGGEFPAEALGSSSVVLSMLYLGLFSTMIAFVLQNVCQKYLRPATASLLMSTESVFGVLCSVLFLHELMNGRMVIGCALIFAAIVLNEIKPGKNGLFAAFYPDEYMASAYVIDYDRLYAEGYRGLIFDIDNTLVPHGAPADERSIALFEHLKELGFRILLLSNNKEPRVKLFNDAVHVEYIHKANKPAAASYLRAMEQLGSDTDTTIFIGDQLFTDVWGAKNAGVRNILVKPIHPKEEIQIVLKRVLERVVLYFYEKRLQK